jgi:hypothetical protein
VRLRHAWLNLDFGDGWSVRAGQSWDLLGPHQQAKLNTAVGWQQGNIAFRRALLSGKKVVRLDDTTKLDFALAIARPIAEDIDGLGDADGDDAGLPDFQGRIGVVTDLFTDAEPARIGLGGFIGEREADFDEEEEYCAWALALDLYVPILPGLKLVSEVYTGQSLSSYNAGLKNDFDKTTMDEVQTKGGFVNLHHKPDKHWLFVLGAGIDDPDDEHLSAGKRNRNTSIFFNVRYKLTKQVIVGLEYDRMTTWYEDGDDVDNHRFQMTWMLKW